MQVAALRGAPGGPAGLREQVHGQARCHRGAAPNPAGHRAVQDSPAQRELGIYTPMPPLRAEGCGDGGTLSLQLGGGVTHQGRGSRFGSWGASVSPQLCSHLSGPAPSPPHPPQEARCSPLETRSPHLLETPANLADPGGQQPPNTSATVDQVPPSVSHM